MQQVQNIFPIFHSHYSSKYKTNHIILQQQALQFISHDHLHQFQQEGIISLNKPTMINFISVKKMKKLTLKESVNVKFSNKVQQISNFYGMASSFLASAYTFNLKSIKDPILQIYLGQDLKDMQKILNLTYCLMESRCLANGRGDQYGKPSYFVQIAQKLAKDYQLGIHVIRGNQLLNSGLRLFHAVGRGSIHEPALISLAYNGDKESASWIALVGKGICFDSGGYDLKNAEGMKFMFLDKSGAVSCYSAFKYIVKQKLKINVTIVLGMAQNMISNRSYRPSDIIRSKKGITVQIADTDAQGRLVLADCMSWVQQKYKITQLIQLSTLTYSCIQALGSNYAGLFGNNQQFKDLLKQVGKQVDEKSWELPLDQSHREMIQSEIADCISDVNDGSPGASIAAAFLQKFVQKQVKWIHLDVGPCVNFSQCSGTGFGARLLLQIIRRLSIK